MILTPRWTQLRFHAIQQALWNTDKRFVTVPAGRRSGKTELLKRRAVKASLRGTAFPNARFALCAPTHAQAKRIFWDDIKALSPKAFLSGKPSESELVVEYINGSQIHIIGLDKPERIEGSPWDGVGITEIGNVKANAWPANIRPALADRNGWGVLEGVPEGRNHYYDMDQKAQASMLDPYGEWGSYTWKSADILNPAEIEAARMDLDELTFQQEYEASFLNFFGRAYYPFDQRTHCSTLLQWDKRQPLIFTFDFNIAPGTAAVIQEQKMPFQYAEKKSPAGVITGKEQIFGTGVIGEVFIPRNSNTNAVCDKLIQDWGAHEGRVLCYGDATGGAGGTAKVAGSDWDLIAKKMRGHFGSRAVMMQQPGNPRERVRVNAVNTRLQNGAGHIRLMVDPAKAPNVVKDFDGVQLLEGGSGELDKDENPLLTHLTDGIGYYVNQEFPIESKRMVEARIIGV